MQAMIFSAQSADALQKVRGRALIVWHILNLVRAEIADIVLQHDDASDLLETTLGTGAQFGARLRYCGPQPGLGATLDAALDAPVNAAFDHALQAREQLGAAPFIGVTANIYCPHFPFASLFDALEESDLWGNPYPADERDIAWISLVKNPSHQPEGDFSLTSFSVSNEGLPRHTFAGIGIYRPEILAGVPAGQTIDLPALLREFAQRAQVGGDVYRGDWVKVDHAAQCALLNAPFSPPALPGHSA